MDLLADTVFLIDLWREARAPGPATAYAKAHISLQVAIPWVAAGEFLSGALAAGQDSDLVTAFLARYPVLHSDAATVRSYAGIYADLRGRGVMIGPNDLWIAASALVNGLPLLTRNTTDFGYVEGLDVVNYSATGDNEPRH